MPTFFFVVKLFFSEPSGGLVSYTIKLALIVIFVTFPLRIKDRGDILKKLILLLILLLISTSMLFSQTSSSKNIRMFLDFARFRYDEHNTYLEIYYLLHNMGKEKLNQTNEILLEFSLSDENKDSLLATSLLKVSLENGVSNGNGLDGVQGSLIKTVLPTGKYKIKMVRLSEDRTQRLDSLNQVFASPSFKTDKIALSDLELCSNIVTGSKNEKGLFYKNTMEVFPNPMRIYNQDNSELYYYIELYNIRSENPQDEVKIEVAIADTHGNIKEQKNYTRNRAYESLVEFGFFDVGTLANGLYTLVFAATDATANYSTYTRTNFYVVNASAITSDQENMIAAFPKSEYMFMSETEADEKINQALYIGTREEKEIAKTLTDVESKRLFLFKFWFNRENPVMEGLKDEYYSRVDYANEHYAFSNRKGWQSDRGRVYIVYGQPSDIDRQPHNPEGKPYEIWTYHELEGGVKFLFVDVTGFGDYKLMSSTMRGEIHDPGWDDLLIFGRQ